MWRTQRERKHSASQRLALARALWGWQPHPQQKKLFTSPAQVTVAACGRRWGKTECLSADIASLALHELAQGRPCRQLVVAPTDTQARLIGTEIHRRLAAAVEALNADVLKAQERDALKALERDAPVSGSPMIGGRGDAGNLSGLTLTVRQKPALTLTLTCPAHPQSDCTITCRTAGRDGRSLRGLWAHRIIVDEAAYVPDSVLSDVLMPMLLDRGGDYLLASSPNGKRSAYYRLFAQAMSAQAISAQAISAQAITTQAISAQAISAQAASGPHEARTITYRAFQFPTQNNPHLDLAYLHSQREEMGEAMFAQEYEAQFLDVGGNVFREDDLEAALQTDPRVTLGPSGELLSDPHPGRIYAIGVDWGRKFDFTVVCILDCTDPVARLVGLWRWQGTGWETQVILVAEIVAKFNPWAVWGDGSGIGDTLTERLQAAIRQAVLSRDPDARVPRFQPFLFTGSSKQDLVDRLTLRLSARTLAFPSHRILLRELRAFEYLACGPSGTPRTGAHSGAHDDIVMALGLALLAAPEAAPTPLASLILLGSSVGGMRRGS